MILKIQHVFYVYIENDIIDFDNSIKIYVKNYWTQMIWWTWKHWPR